MSALVVLGVIALGACGGGSGGETAKPQSTGLNAATAAAGAASAASAVPAATTATADTATTAAASAPDAAASGSTAGTQTPRVASGGNPSKPRAPAAPAPAVAASPTPITKAPAPAATTTATTGIGAAPAPAGVESTATALAATARVASPAPAPAAPVYRGPVTLSKGGTYSGNWESTNPGTAAVTITTTDPVIIQSCNIRSVGAGIQSVYAGTQITVRNCMALMNLPNVAGKSAGRFVSLYGPRSFIGENNEINGGGGFYIDGAGRGADLIRVRYNKQTNVDGRQSDGKGGYSTGYNILQFLQLNNVQGIKDGEVSWNQVINQPYKSRVEDNINLHLTRGLSTRKFPVQNNYIQGAYPADPVRDGFSGGGIIVDGSASTADSASGYISIGANQVISTSNYGIAISAGLNSEIKGNRSISTGLLPTGEKIASANVGVYIWDIANNAATGSFSGNVANGNDVYWINNAAQRNDTWFPNCAVGGCTPNSTLSAASANVAGPLSVENLEFSSWQAKLSANLVKLGIQ